MNESLVRRGRGSTDGTMGRALATDSRRIGKLRPGTQVARFRSVVRGRAMAQSVTLELDGRVAIVTLNRPEVLNAIDTQLASDLAATCDELQAREEVWVAILRGAGERAFSAGADLKERQDMS